MQPRDRRVSGARRAAERADVRIGADAAEAVADVYSSEDDAVGCVGAAGAAGRGAAPAGAAAPQPRVKAPAAVLPAAAPVPGCTDAAAGAQPQVVAPAPAPAPAPKGLGLEPRPEGKRSAPAGSARPSVYARRSRDDNERNAVAGGRARARRRRREPSPDDDDDDDDDDEHAAVMRTWRRLANWDFCAEVLRRLNGAGSCYRYVSNVRFHFKSARNECLHLARFIDAYLAIEIDGVSLPYDSELFDLMCRRLMGVLIADERRNWSFAAVTQRSGLSPIGSNELAYLMWSAARAMRRRPRAEAR